MKKIKVDKIELKRVVYKCQSCGKEYQSNEVVTICPCGGVYEPM